MGYTHGTSADAKMRTCTSCGKTFPNTHDYYAYSDQNKGTLLAICKSCQKKASKIKNEKIKTKNKDLNYSNLFYEGTRLCKKCKRELPNDYLHFPTDKTCKDGLRNICRECDQKYRKFLKEGYIPFQKWSEEEILLLKKVYHDYSNEEIVKLFLPNRSIRAIETQASLLGIGYKSDAGKQRISKQKGKKISAKGKGRKLTEERKKIISEQKIEFYKTHNSPMKGVKLSPERCKEISDRQKGKWFGDKNPRHLNPLSGEKNGRWNGGLTDIKNEFRTRIPEWKQSSMEFCNYKCVITGLEFDDIHHLYSFSKIFDSIFVNTKIPKKERVLDYNNLEIEQLEKEIKKLHTLECYDACLTQDLHKLFHDNYGYTNFTPYDFIDFLNRIEYGEFDCWFKENNVRKNINYDYFAYIKDFYSLKEAK